MLMKYKVTIANDYFIVAVHPELEEFFLLDYGHLSKVVHIYEVIDFELSLNIGNATPCNKKDNASHQLSCSQPDRLHWEREIRCNLTAILAGKIFELSNTIRMHGGAVSINEETVFITGGSGAGKSSLVMSLVYEAQALYAGHEIVFMNGSQLYGFPQPITLAEGAFQYFSLKAYYKPELSATTPKLKNLYKVEENRTKIILPKPSIVVIPQRTPFKPEEGIHEIEPDIVLAHLKRQIELPIVGNKKTVDNLEEYYQNAELILKGISNESQGYLALWHENQSEIVNKIKLVMGQ